MNSCLYECDIMHCRLQPRRHQFTHKIFMFYLDLDELRLLTKKIPCLGYNRFNLYNFCNRDHLELGASSVKENILRYLKSKGVDLTKGKIKLLTNLRTLGYNFNPVSFYFCFDQNNVPVCVVPEIGNTFGELKPYFIGKEDFQNQTFVSCQTKYFYISPFVELDAVMDFQIKIPEERLNIRIDDIRHGEKFFYSSMSGEKKELSQFNLLKYSLRFPLVTLKVIGLIHLHALWLYLKKIPHYQKENHPHMQKEVYRAWSKN